MNKHSSHKSDDQIETDFLDAVAERSDAERRERRRKRALLSIDFLFEFVMASSISAVGFLLAAFIYSPLLGPALAVTAVWIAATTLCIAKVRPLIKERATQPERKIEASP